MSPKRFAGSCPTGMGSRGGMGGGVQLISRGGEECSQLSPVPLGGPAGSKAPAAGEAREAAWEGQMWVNKGSAEPTLGGANDEASFGNCFQERMFMGNEICLYSKCGPSLLHGSLQCLRVVKLRSEQGWSAGAPCLHFAPGI